MFFWSTRTASQFTSTCYIIFCNLTRALCSFSFFSYCLWQWLCETCQLVDNLVRQFAPQSHTSFDKISNVAQLVQDLVFTYRKEMLDPEASCVLKLIYTQLIR